MADFAIWAATCETTFWPAGTFARAYAANRMAAIESIIDADPVAACVRQIMTERSTWEGSAAELLQAGNSPRHDGFLGRRAGWPDNPRALAGRLRRVQTFLRTLGIEITFSRKGNSGVRMITMSSAMEKPRSTVSTVCNNGSRFGL
jgi:hypothetical protein